jgi:uncharacterized protein YcbX
MELPGPFSIGLTVVVITYPLLFLFLNYIGIIKIPAFSLPGIIKRALAIRSFKSRTSDESNSVLVGYVKSLHTYPLKSGKGLNHSSIEIGALGPVGDRQFMVLRRGDDAQDPAMKGTWRFFTQRHCPVLALIVVKPLPSNEGSNPEAHRYELSCPSLGPESSTAIISHPPTADDNAVAGDFLSCVIWNDKITLKNHGLKISKWVTQIVNKWEYINNEEEAADFQSMEEYPLSIWGELRVGSIPIGAESAKYNREASKKYTSPLALGRNGLPPHVTLADGFPLLLTSSSSLKLVNDKIKSEGGSMVLEMNRFRPNVVVGTIDGVNGFDEDHWREITIGKPMRCDMKGKCSGGAKDGASFSLLKGCARCKESCTDQSTGEVTVEPSKSLRTFRCMQSLVQPSVDGGRPGKIADDVYFGQNCICHSFNKGERPIEVGDEVRVWRSERHGIYDGEPVAAE